MKKQLDLVSKLLTLTKFQSCYCKCVIFFEQVFCEEKFITLTFILNRNIVGKCSRSAGTKLD